jgi:hypothetical protein
MLRRLREEYVLDHSAQRAAELTSESVAQLVFLFNDLLLWTTPTFDITGFVDLSQLVVLPSQLSHMPFSLSLAVKGRPWTPDMTFVTKDQAEYDEWRRVLDAAIHTASEHAAAAAKMGGVAPVRILAREESARMGHMRARSTGGGGAAGGGGGGGSPSPQPLVDGGPGAGLASSVSVRSAGAGLLSPPPVGGEGSATRASHPLDGPSSAHNYRMQHPTPKRAQPPLPNQSPSPNPQQQPPPNAQAHAAHELEF